MREKYVNLLQELIITQMNHWPLFTVALAIYIMGGGKTPVMWMWALCSLLPFVLYLIREYLKDRFTFLLTHILSGAVFWILPLSDSMHQTVLKIMVIGYLLRSIQLRIRGGDQKEVGMYAGIGVGMIAFSILFIHQQKGNNWNQYYFFSLIAFVGLHFLRTFIDSYLRFLTVNASSAGYIPKKEMFLNGMRTALIFTGGGVVFLLLLFNFQFFSGIIDRLIEMLVKFLRMLLSKLLKEPEAKDPTESWEVPEMPPMTEELAGEQGLFWVILQKIIITVVILSFILAIILGIIVLTRFMIVRLKGNKKEVQEEEEEVKDVREKFNRDELFKRKKRPLSMLDPRERIRKIFQKRVIAGKSKILGSHSSARLEIFTARECADRLEQELLGNLYEKARYSEEECTMDDVRALKEDG